MTYSRNNNLTEANQLLLEACQSGADWNRACDAIKELHGGHYPTDWYEKVIQSGVGDRIAARWGQDMKLHVTADENLDAGEVCDTYSTYYAGITWSWEADMDGPDIQDFKLLSTEWDTRDWSDAYATTEGDPSNPYHGLDVVKLAGQDEPPEELVPAWMVKALEEDAKRAAYTDYGKWLEVQKIYAADFAGEQRSERG